MFITGKKSIFNHQTIVKFGFAHLTLKPEIFDHPTIKPVHIWPSGDFFSANMPEHVFH
jgi:hypothetical protein